ncbi:hypothetical protein [Mycobacterium sp.]|uniref:hypothetical protein n=1 Tax=Mycobacterium sp. TaxID=1785 RepID=UPI002D0486E2|nr:hypothetical protein [Mycobacterium sp.]HTY31760.1 hypothetical protein [Mycobacterium sp.]
MAKTPKDEYQAVRSYRGGADAMIGATLEQAERQAAEWTAEMRREGAASAIRRVAVEVWRKDGQLAGPPGKKPVLFEASYYDPEQGLTDDQAYTARVHDWHAKADGWNSRSQPKYHANHPNHGRCWTRDVMSYGDWSDDWGPKPTTCPACGQTVDPQDRFDPQYPPFGTAARPRPA